MLRLLTSLLVLHISGAQSSCRPETCNSEPTRERVTECRMFCSWADAEGNFVTQTSLNAHFDQLMDPVWGTIDRVTFVQYFVLTAGMCGSEGNAMFDFINSLTVSDPDFLQQEDIDALWDFMQEGQVDTQVQCHIASTSGVSDQAIQGLVMFSQPPSGGAVVVDVDISNFDPEDGELLHGFHVHANPSTGNQCSDAGGHYNPYGYNHAAPTSQERHVGDLGNIREFDGRVVTSLTDAVISLRAEDGPSDISDRAVVVHATEDDLGLGGDAGSIIHGNAGPRLGCCVISPFDNAAAVSKRGFRFSWTTIYSIIFDPFC